MYLPKAKGGENELKFDTKKFLKQIKLNEDNISMILGAVVIVIAGILVINYFKEKGNTSVPGVTTQIQNTNEHIVVKGETLWSIAEDAFGSGYNWTDIQKANKLTADDIEVGQKLIIPDATTKEPTSTKVVTKITTENSITNDNYTVVKGDCLWTIAVRAYGDGFKWVEIAKANKLTNPNLIYPGNILTLPR